MPGIYTVNNRHAPAIQADLVSQLPPASGPIILPGGNAGLQYRAMGQNIVGDTQTFASPGIWTDSISDCIVLFAIELNPQTMQWTDFCWEHLRGGLNNHWRQQFQMHIANPNNCFAVVAARDWIGTDSMVTDMVNLNIPVNHITVYIAKQDFKFGVRFNNGQFGEV